MSEKIDLKAAYEIRRISLQVAIQMGWEQINDVVWCSQDGITRQVALLHEATLYPKFEPAIDENDAALALDRISDLGWMVTVYTGPYPGRGIVRRCCIMRGPQDAVLDSIVDVFAETRPLAICQAFIEAVERWGGE